MISITKICILCQSKNKDPYAVCNACITLLPQLHQTCIKCAIPLPQIGLCGQCLQHPSDIDQICIHYPFIEPLRTLIHLFKYHAGLYLTRLLAQLMLPTQQDYPEVLIPVPIHPKRLRERGFNQSLLLAQQLSQQLQIPYDQICCKKIKHTLSQTTLSVQERKKNLMHHYHIKPHPYQRITIIDDVYTTGSTVQAIAQLFKSTGVKWVSVWCIARTI